ncbi:hypothetical protein [Aquimarina spinulae]|uniref:hypothetical protein n=1 Tax=Aquimarina spinulae TaxID=1192023 RepID=UPI000D557A00|nr:hypothetical protein [Aquimarina spinulae]
MNLTRKQLYDLVWSKPLTQLAKEYAISDNGLRKICKKHNIPLPKLGHWQKLRYGKKLRVIPLPEAGNEVEISLKQRKEGDENEYNYLSEYHKLKKEIENDTTLNLIIPDELSKPDPLIIQTRKKLKTIKPSTWTQSKGLIISPEDALNIEASKSSIPRALRFMDILIKVLKQRGHQVKIKEHRTFVIIEEEEIEIRCREKIKRIISESNSWSEYIPSGVLSFKIDNSYPDKEWKDGKKKRLEDQLSNILTYLELKSKKIKKERAEREERKRQLEIQRKREEEAKRIRDNELQKFQELLSLSRKYKIASEIRSLINTKKQLAKEQNIFSEETKQWINWAQDKADWIDPFVNKSEDEILGILKNDYLKKDDYNTICKFRKWYSY